MRGRDPRFDCIKYKGVAYDSSAEPVVAWREQAVPDAMSADRRLAAHEGNDDHDGSEGFDHAAANGMPMNAHGGALVLPERPMREAMTSDLSVIAAQLIEAARRARDGDREAAREYIAHAVTLFHGKLGFGPSVMGGLSNAGSAAADGCIDDGYELLIKCLRTGAVHGLRMIFADGGPQIFPLLENLYHAPTTSRSLSRREAGVLQMIARGMSNKCIARSLGIAPETVKTHVKAILNKLEARTRAQAVARAEAIRLP
jgi:DNA-binding CsgD family transcriptional regulator